MAVVDVGGGTTLAVEDDVGADDFGWVSFLVAAELIVFTFYAFVRSSCSCSRVLEIHL